MVSEKIILWQIIVWLNLICTLKWCDIILWTDEACLQISVCNITNCKTLCCECMCGYSRILHAYLEY